MSGASHVEGLIPMLAKHTVGILLFTNMLSQYYSTRWYVSISFFQNYFCFLVCLPIFFPVILLFISIKIITFTTKFALSYLISMSKHLLEGGGGGRQLESDFSRPISPQKLLSIYNNVQKKTFFDIFIFSFSFPPLLVVEDIYVTFVSQIITNFHLHIFIQICIYIFLHVLVLTCAPPLQT